LSFDADLELAFELADLAGRIALEPFQRKRYQVSQKLDGSLVTEVDGAVESAIRARLAEQRPGHQVIGEEHGQSGSSDRCWYVDPIDGTHRFLRGDPKWMTLIALSACGEVVLGVVALPALAERWWACRGQGAFHDGRRLAVSPTQPLSKATISDDWRSSMRSGVVDSPLASVASKCARVKPHQGHAFLALAAGVVDVALQTGSNPWDYAPLKVIVEEAGGRFSDFRGGPRIDTGQVVATNGRIHDETLELLRRWARDTRLAT
jgi:histidinol-phosphatase